jgi:hypothetical protein
MQKGDIAHKQLGIQGVQWGGFVRGSEGSWVREGETETLHMFQTEFRVR